MPKGSQGLSDLVAYFYARAQNPFTKIFLEVILPDVINTNVKTIVTPVW
jgi:hypothetical protein